MIDDLDRSLQKLIEIEFGKPLPFDLSFAIPDKNFKPVSIQRSTLNCYLYDIRENRELRDVGRYAEPRPGGMYAIDSPPCRVKASFCITAWSPATATPGVDPYLDEHNLLAAVLRALLRYPEFPPMALVGTLVGQALSMPTIVAQPDAARNTGDFWNAIGGQLRPSIEYSVTISLDYRAVDEGTLASSVTSRTSERVGDRLSAPFDTRYAIGGTVWSNSTPNVPVPDAWVRVDQTGELAVADASGRFTMQRMPPGNYTLTVRASGFKQGSKMLAVPLQAGSFDVILDPL